jgi:hypothetical protein
VKVLLINPKRSIAKIEKVSVLSVPCRLMVVAVCGDQRLASDLSRLLLSAGVKQRPANQPRAPISFTQLCHCLANPAADIGSASGTQSVA